MIRNRSDGTFNDAVEEWQWFLESRSIFISLLLSAKQVKQGFTAYQRQGNSIQKHIGKNGKQEYPTAILLQGWQKYVGSIEGGLGKVND